MESRRIVPGYGTTNQARTGSPSYAEWRAPIQHAERIAAADWEWLPAAFGAILHHWLDHAIACDARRFGTTRFHPACAAALCDAFFQSVAAHGVPAGCSLNAQWCERDATSATAVQAYSVWYRIGRVGPPSPADVTQGWTAADLDVLRREGGRCTPTLLQRFE